MSDANGILENSDPYSSKNTVSRAVSADTGLCTVSIPRRGMWEPQ